MKTLTTSFIPSPSSNGFHLGPLFVHAYGWAYVVAVAAAILVTRELWRRDGGDPKLPQEIAIWAFPGGLIGGRIYFLITTPSQMPPHWWGPFAIWKGGLGIWGGVGAGVLVGLWYVRRRGLTGPQMLRLMDRAAPALLVAQAIGRIGSYFTRSCSASRARCRGRFRSIPRTARPTTRSSRPSSPHSSTSWSGTCCWPACWCGWCAVTGSVRPERSRCTWPDTRAFGSSRRTCGSTTRNTSWACA